MKHDAVENLPFVSSVLHPTDFSAASERALAYALAIALIRQTELTILHVNPHKNVEVDWTRFPPVREILERWGLLESEGYAEYFGSMFAPPRQRYIERALLS